MSCSSLRAFLRHIMQAQCAVLLESLSFNMAGKKCILCAFLHAPDKFNASRTAEPDRELVQPVDNRSVSMRAQ